jgi:hypothetical protein
VEPIDLWKYRDRIRRRRERSLVFCILLAGLATACVAEPGIPAWVAVTIAPSSPPGRTAAVYLLDRELDQALAAYRDDEAAHRYIAGNFEMIGARDEGLAGEASQRELYLEAMEKHIVALQAERRKLAVLAGVKSHVDREIDYWSLDDAK